VSRIEIDIYCYASAILVIVLPVLASIAIGLFVISRQDEPDDAHDVAGQPPRGAKAA